MARSRFSLAAGIPFTMLAGATLFAQTTNAAPSAPPAYRVENRCWWPAYAQNCPPQWAPLPQSVRTLRLSEVRELLGERYQIVGSVRLIAPVTLADFATVWGQPFAAIDPGQPMIPEAFPGPHRQLVFAAWSRDTAILVFVSGGFVDTLNVAVFTHAFGGGVWKAVLRDLPSHDVAGVQAALRTGQFVTPGQIEQP